MWQWHDELADELDAPYISRIEVYDELRRANQRPSQKGRNDFYVNLDD